MLLGLSLLLILAGVFEFVGHLQMNSVTKKAAFDRQVSRCERLFAAVDRTNPADPKTGKSSSEWNKAKDSFLASVSTLSQSSSLTSSDKAAVADIQKAWKAYESTLPHQSAAGAAAVRSVVQRTIDKVSKTSEASLKQALATTDFGLRVATLIGSALGVGIVLLIARSLRSRFEEIRNQLKAVTQIRNVQVQTNATSEDDLKLQADQLTKAVSELNAFIGQNISEQTPTEEKASAREELDAVISGKN
jgi:hypothetical protein